MSLKKWILVLSIAGSLFSGYMSGFKLLTKTCAFKESCPIFLGLPACYFGFALFFSLLVISILLKRSKGTSPALTKAGLFVSGLGILFAGNFTLRELPVLFTKGLGAYFFGLPTCALGLIFFASIFYLYTRLFLIKETPSDNS